MMSTSATLSAVFSPHSDCLEVVDEVQINTQQQQGCNLCDLFLSCFDNDSSLYSNIRRQFGDCLYSQTAWQESNLNTLSREVSYRPNHGDEDELIREKHHISLVDFVDGEWKHLKLTVRSTIGNCDTSLDTPVEVIWQLCFSVHTDGFELKILRDETTPDSARKMVCDVDTIRSVVVDEVSNLYQSEVESAETLLRLVACSTITETADIPLQAARSVEENFNEIFARQSTDTCGDDDAGSNSGDVAAAGLPVTVSAVADPPHSQVFVEEFIYFSIKLGIHFRLHNSDIIVGGIEDAAAAADDDETCHALENNDVAAVRDRCSLEDIEYCNALNISRTNRPLDCAKPSQASENEAQSENVTGQMSTESERLWAAGADGIKPTYYISGVVPRRPSSGRTPVVATTPSSAGVSSHAPVSAESVPTATLAGSDFSGDPRSPSSRTPIVTATAVSVVAVEEEDPFDGIEEVVKSATAPPFRGVSPLQPVGLSEELRAVHTDNSVAEDLSAALSEEKDATSEPLAVDNKSQSYKILVQCRRFLGDAKKVWKVDLQVPPADHHEAAAIALEHLTLSLVEKYHLPHPYLEAVEVPNVRLVELSRLSVEPDAAEVVMMRKMTLEYFDSDLEETVSLDADAYEDFLAQNKKILHVLYDTEVRVALVSTESNSTDTDGKVTDSVGRDSPDGACTEGQEESKEYIQEEIVDKESPPAIVQVGSTPQKVVIHGEKASEWRWVSKGCVDVGPSVGSLLVGVNGVRMKGLDRSLMLSVLKQRTRPLVLEFEHELVAETPSSSPPVFNTPPPAPRSSSTGSRSSGKKTNSDTGSETPRSARKDLVDEAVSRDHTRIPASTFLAKYSHPVAKPLRKQVEKVLKNYLQCDWESALRSTDGRAGPGSPQMFITSLYRSIESELENLGLFDSSKPQGGGIPVMQDTHWADVRAHIESIVFNSIYDFTWGLAPPMGVYEVLSNAIPPSAIGNEGAIQGSVTQRGLVPLQTKLSYLSFLTLQNMGLDMPEQLPNPVVYFPQIESVTQGRRRSSLSEEWRLALKEISRACEMKSPLKIMQRLKVAITMATHALESMMCHSDRYLSASSSGEGDFSPLQPPEDEMRGGCGDILRRTQVRRSGFYKPSMLGADELMPLLSWVIIQANPPFIERAIWLCAEFRHHTMHMGECAYALTQISSALEFVKEASWQSFVISEDRYMAGLKRYEATQDLIDACRKGHSNDVKELLLRGANVNGYSPDQSNTPLSVAIKHKHLHVLGLLLSHGDMDVNLRISPYHSPAHPSSSPDNRTRGAIEEKSKQLRDYTALMLAALMGNVEVVVLLLDSGANRYLMSEGGDTAASLAYAAGHREVVRVILADPYRISIISAIRNGDVFLTRGLACQSSVNLNCLISIECAGNNSTGTILMAAVHERNVDLVNVLINTGRCHINDRNTHSETALMWCGKASPRQGSTVYAAGDKEDDTVRMDMALALLRCGADRYARDSWGWTPYLWAMKGCSTGGKKPQIDDSTEDELPEFFAADAAVFPRLAAVLYFNPERHSVYDLARRRNLDGVRALLEQGVSVNSACPTLLYTPLIAAVQNKDVPMVEHLLQYPDLEVNKPGRHHMTALHYAAQNGSLRITGLLLRYGADRSATNDNDLTPLDFAASRNHDEVMLCLRYDPKKVSICLAAKHGDFNVFRALVNQGVSVNAKLRHVSDKGCHHELTSPLIAAVYYDQLQFIKSILENQTDLILQEEIDINIRNFLGQTPLMYAASKGNESIVLYLLKRGADRYLRDKDGLTAFDWAQKGGYTSVYMILQCDPQLSSVHGAIRDGSVEATVAFFKQAPDPNLRWFSSHPFTAGATTGISGDAPVRAAAANVRGRSDSLNRDILDGEPPLIVAAKFNRITIINILLRAPGIDIDIVDTFGKTPIMHAAEKGHEEAVLLLLKHKANRYAMDYCQKRAIHYAMEEMHDSVVAILEADPYKVYIHDACEEGQDKLVLALMKQGCPVNFRDERAGKHSRTPLMSACSKGQLTVAKLLINTPGVDLNAQDSDGMTALMLAARIGALEVTGVLMTAGCDRNLTDKKGRTADSHASSHGYMTMIQFKGQQIVR